MAVIIVPITKIAQANQDRFDIEFFLPSAARLQPFCSINANLGT